MVAQPVSGGQSSSQGVWELAGPVTLGRGRGWGEGWGQAEQVPDTRMPGLWWRLTWRKPISLGIGEQGCKSALPDRCSTEGPGSLHTR